MVQPFYARLSNYFRQVADVLKGTSDGAAIFPNSSDIGVSRELAYVKVLSMHSPSRCTVNLGGFLFGDDGSESGQIDVIVITDTAPRYDFLNSDGKGKSFSPVEGTLLAASIKSTLDKTQLFDALDGIAKIPPTAPLGDRVNPQLKIVNYDDWPFTVIYASKGSHFATIFRHVKDYYAANPDIPLTRRPHVIQVAGEYALFRKTQDFSWHDASTNERSEVDLGNYVITKVDSDIQALMWTFHKLQEKATASAQILFSYGDIINKMPLQALAKK